MRGGVLSIVVAGLVLACRTPPALPPLPSDGGPAWTELTSEHFVMWTDAAPARGRALLAKLERFHQLVHGIAFPTEPATTQVLVVVFRNAEERGAFVPPQFTAFAWTGLEIFQPLIVLDAETDDTRVLAHELTHVISHAVVPAQPAWFAEGLAGYFETVNLDAAGSKVDVGRPHPSMLARVARGNTTPVAQLFACVVPACMDDRFYATTSLLFAYLVNQHPAALLRYLERLAEVPAARQAAVWSEVFPALPPARLDHALRAWLVAGRARVWTFDVALARPAIAARPIGDGEVLAARGLLRHVFAPRAPAEPPEIAAALAADPANLLAHLTRAGRTRAMEVAIARRLVGAHPQDWRAWLWLGYALAQDGGGPEVIDARRRSCALAGRSHLVPAGWCPAP